MSLSTNPPEENHPQTSTCVIRHEASHATVLPWLYLTLALLGLPTNGVLLMDLWRSEKTPTVIFTLNLVVSDLVMCCSFFFRTGFHKHSTDWDAGAPVCRAFGLLINFCFYTNLYCNMFFLLWTSINRYATVVNPVAAFFRAFRRARPCWTICFCTWLVVTTLTGSSVWLKHSRRINGTCFDRNSGSAVRSHIKMVQSVGVSGFFFILCLMMASYGLLVFHLQKMRKGSLVNETSGPASLKVRRKILASVLVFVLCFLPYHLQRIMLLKSAGPDCQAQYRIKTATIFLASVSCCLHPVLQLVFRLPCCRASRCPRNAAKPEPSRSLQAPQVYSISTANFPSTNQ